MVRYSVCSRARIVARDLYEMSEGGYRTRE